MCRYNYEYLNGGPSANGQGHSNFSHEHTLVLMLSCVGAHKQEHAHAILTRISKYVLYSLEKQEKPREKRYKVSKDEG